MAKKDLMMLSLVGVALALLFLPGFSKYQELRSQNRSLRVAVTALEKENKRLREERKKLETDVVFVEKMAREKMGVVRKGEIVYRAVPEEEKK